jgi:signal transduction histidine kinase
VSTDTPVAAGSAALQVIARLVMAEADPVTLSGAVASGLARLLPGSSVAVLSIEPLRPVVRILATGGASALVVPVERASRPDSLIVDCARKPLSVARMDGAAVRDQVQLGRGAIEQAALLGVAVPVGVSSTWVLLLALPSAAVDDDTLENLRVFASILRSVLRELPSAGRDGNVDEAIRRAKDEWELTADALPHIVCLLDATGRVLRCNRAIERWSLGDIAGVLGKNYHDFLHPHCGGDCALAKGVAQAFERMRNERRRAYEFQVADRALARVVKLRLGRMPGCDGTARESATACAVLVVQDVTDFETAKQRLATMTQELELRVAERTRELADANRELQAEIARRNASEESLREKSSELAALSAGLMQAQEQERTRISRELHDSVGQSLNALKYGLERAAELERQGQHSGARDALEKSIATTQETMNEVRGIAHDLRPSVLDNLGAASAVAWFSRAFASSYPDLLVVPEIAVRDDEVPARLATTIFRSLQELLNNVARHARARRVDVGLRLEGTRIVLEVRDDGVGPQGSAHEARVGEGQGMRNLRERAQLTGGTFELAAGSPQGAVAQVSWVLSPDEAAASSTEIGGGTLT